MATLLQTPFAGMCHNPALDPAKLCRRTARPSRFAGAFLSVIRGVLVQLRFDDVRCFGGFERRSHPWS